MFHHECCSFVGLQNERKTFSQPKSLICFSFFGCCCLVSFLFFSMLLCLQYFHNDNVVFVQRSSFFSSSTKLTNILNVPRHFRFVLLVMLSSTTEYFWLCMILLVNLIFFYNFFVFLFLFSFVFCL